MEWNGINTIGVIIPVGANTNHLHATLIKADKLSTNTRKKRKNKSKKRRKYSHK
jgi:hypothetical protein